MSPPLIASCTQGGPLLPPLPTWHTIAPSLGPRNTEDEISLYSWQSTEQPPPFWRQDLSICCSTHVGLWRQGSKTENARSSPGWRDGSQQWQTELLSAPFFRYKGHWLMELQKTVTYGDNIRCSCVKCFNWMETHKVDLPNCATPAGFFLFCFSGFFFLIQHWTSSHSSK